MSDPIDSPDTEPASLLSGIEADVRALLRQASEFRTAADAGKRDLAKAERDWILRLIAIGDAFDRVLNHVNSQPDRINEQMRAWLGNFKAVRRLVDRQLTETGVTVMPAEDVFDPERHTVAETVADQARPDGLIIDVLQPGYAKGDEIVRKANVRVVSNGE
jgi:molecular chaperone GrpE